MPRLRSRALAAISALALAHAAGAGAGETCEAPPRNGPVSIVILRSPAKVHALAASMSHNATAVVRDTATVVFEDGRVITADVTEATRHLNQLGWGERRIDVVASFPKRRARPRGSFG